MNEKVNVEVNVEIQVAPAFIDLVSEDRLRRVAETVLRYEEEPGDVTVVITDDEGIQELNRDFLGIDEPTDVLSFGTEKESGPFVASPETIKYLGDVIVSYPRAEEQAGEQDYPVQRELDLLVVHGVLHLLGYDHAEEEEKVHMWTRQDDILTKLWVGS
ncbi:MAG: rRNA maturation RNase YbeY [Anaerolineae bacterium]|nr:rRNA maturation RNase YbeY [Anaerolineae bacterium]